MAEKPQESVKCKGVPRMVRGGERRKEVKVEENRWHSALSATLATWLFQNESNAWPRNKKKRRGKNQYTAIKHKASLCGAERNLLFIKFTPPPPSLHNSLQSLMHELPLRLRSSLQVIWPLWLRLDWNDCGRRPGKSGVFSLIDPSRRELCSRRRVALERRRVSLAYFYTVVVTLRGTKCSLISHLLINMQQLCFCFLTCRTI